MLAAVLAVLTVDLQPPTTEVEPVGSPTATSGSVTPSPTPTDEPPSATPSPEPRAEVLVPEGPADGPATGTTVAAMSVRDDGTLRLVRLDADGQGRAFTVVTDDTATTLASLAVDPEGDVGFHVHLDGGTSVYRLDRDAVTPTLVTSASPPDQARLVGAGDVAGGPVLLVAEGRATSLQDDSGTDLVAYTSGGERRVLVEEAALAWESGVVAADVGFGWVAWERRDTVVSTVLAASLDAPDDVVEVLRGGDGESAPEPAGVALAGAAGTPVVGVLLHHRAGFPEEPRGELVTFELPDLQERRYELDGINWSEGLPWALDRMGGEWLVSRMGEGLSTRTALVGMPGDWRVLELDGVVRSSG